MNAPVADALALFRHEPNAVLRYGKFIGLASLIGPDSLASRFTCRICSESDRDLCVLWTACSANNPLKNR